MKVLTFSFDDCEIHDRRLCDLLRKYSIKATFYLLSGLLGQRVPYHRYGVDTVVERVTAEEIPSTYAGMEVADHTLYHRIEDTTFPADTRQSGEILSKACGYEIKGFAYPGGHFTAHQLSLLKATGLLYARGATHSHNFLLPEDWYIWQPTSHYADPELPQLIQTFLALPGDEDALFHIYGHSYELTEQNSNRDWQYLEQLLQQLAGREDIVYATNLEAFRLLSQQ